MAKIAIDAGHGLKTAGKRCLKSLDKNETREWVLNDRVSNALEIYLESAGHTVLRVDDRDGSTDVSLANRVKKANNWDADYYVSIHHNAGTDVEFPQDGPNSRTDITRVGPDAFNLAQIGTYQVQFHVSIDEAAQLILTLNGEDLEYTVAGRATGASEVVGNAIITATEENSILTVRNPAGNAAALTVTPVEGNQICIGTSAHRTASIN